MRAWGAGVSSFAGRRRFRWTEARRARVLEVLRETGNRTAAAAAVGARWSSLDWLCKKDPEFGRQCEEACLAADERLGQADDPFAEGDGYHAIQRTSSGRYQLTAVRKGHWTKRHDDIFFTHLRRTGNIDASARATGFDESTAWDRYYKWPGFRDRWEEVLDQASLALEFRLACEGNQLRLGPDGLEGEGGGVDSHFSGNDEAVEAKFDREFALRFLKWREEKKAGKRRGPARKPPTIEDVTEKIVRRVEAIKRHRKQQESGGQPE